MKKIGWLLCCFMVLSALSCDNEPLETDNNDDPIGEDPGGQSTGDYWPMAIANQWTYEVELDGVPEDNTEMIIEDYVSYQGSQNYLYNSQSPIGGGVGTDGTELGDFTLDFYTRKNGGDYIATTGDLSINYLDIFTLNQTGYSFIFLKDYLETGQTWTQNVTTTTTFESSMEDIPDLPTQTINISMSFEIMGRDLTMTVNDVEYTSVIKVKYTQNSVASVDPTQTIESESFMYFAKDIGLIKSEATQNDVADAVVTTTNQELVSYTLN